MASCLFVVSLALWGTSTVTGDAGAPSSSKTEKATPDGASDPATLRQFDFWVGDWDAVNAQGATIGHNKIEKLLKGHLIQETWTGARGGMGRSLNYFDPKDKKWKQNWIDDKGGVVWYEGTFYDGAMRFTGEHISPTGKVSIARVVLKPIDDDKVHHLIEHSKDGGKTWTDYFNGTYVRRK